MHAAALAVRARYDQGLFLLAPVGVGRDQDVDVGVAVEADEGKKGRDGQLSETTQFSGAALSYKWRCSGDIMSLKSGSHFVHDPYHRTGTRRIVREYGVNPYVNAGPRMEVDVSFG